MKRKFVSNLILLLFLNVLVKPFWVLGIDRTVQNVVGAGEYGLYFSLLNFSILLNIFLDFGINNFNVRNISRNDNAFKESLSGIIALKFILGIAYFIISILIAGIIGYDRDQFNLLFILIMNQFLASFILYFRSNISGLHMFKTDTILSVLDRFLMIIFCGILLWGNIFSTPFQLEWFVYAQFVAYLFTLLLALSINLIKSGYLKLSFNRKYFLKILNKSYPYAILILLMGLYYRVDSILLERLLPENGDVQAGIYAQAFRIMDAFVMLPVLFAGLLLPIFSKMIKKEEAVGQLARFSFLLLVIPALIAAVSMWVYREELMSLLYKEHVKESSDILGFLLISFVSISVTYIFGTLITANGNIRQLNIISFWAVVINLVLNCILIPDYYAMGAAIASIITQLFVMISQGILILKIFRFHIDKKLILIILSFIVGIIGLAFLISLQISKWGIGFIGILVLGFVLAFLLRLINLKQIYYLLRYGE